MSWMDNVDWQQMVENGQKIEMLRLEREQADQLKEQTRLLQAQVSAARVQTATIRVQPQQVDRVFAFVNEINNYIYGYLIPTKSWVEIDLLVKLAASKNVHQQSTNAISNGAVALYLQGRMDEAKEQFQLALDRPDQFAESEASWFLSRIYEETGDEKLAKEYAERCENAGGYSKPSFIH